MAAPRVRAVGAVAIAVAGFLLASCGDLRSPVVVRMGGEVLTVDDLRQAYADLPVPMRPLLGDPTERREFVDVLLRRRFLAELGRQIANARDVSDSSGTSRFDDILVDRLQAVGVGEIAFDEEDDERALALVRRVHRIETLVFRSVGEAASALSELRSGAVTWEELPRRPQVAARPAEWVRWSPFPNPVVDAADSLDVGRVSDPIPLSGSVQVIRVLERAEREAEGDEATSARIRQGLRTREQAVRGRALVQSLRAAADPRVDDDMLHVLVERTLDSILRSGLSEHDAAWAVPVFEGEESSLALVTWSPNGRWTLGDYAATLQRTNAAMRPRAAPIEEEIVRTLTRQVDTRLLLDEARSRNLSEDWWAKRQLAQAQEEVWVGRALEDIQARIRIPPERVDSLATQILVAQPDAFVRSARSRFIRFDFATREDASRERAEIVRAGDATTRLEHVLRGAPSGMRSFHVVTLSPGGIGHPQIEQALFEEGQPEITGPIELGGAWVLVERLAFEPSRRLDSDEIRSDLTDRIRRGEASLAVANWLEERKRERGVLIDEDALSQLAPGT
jgi:hypothetical protein